MYNLSLRETLRASLSVLTWLPAAQAQRQMLPFLVVAAEQQAMAANHLRPNREGR